MTAATNRIKYPTSSHLLTLYSTIPHLTNLFIHSSISSLSPPSANKSRPGLSTESAKAWPWYFGQTQKNALIGACYVEKLLVFAYFIRLANPVNGGTRSVVAASNGVNRTHLKHRPIFDEQSTKNGASNTLTMPFDRTTLRLLEKTFVGEAR